jgi:NAD(P)-dependent dehydrogenase (short-subunit alcohol dehydrogenase family)/uncharacterized protein YndB with AHSA1/START domain
MSNILVTGSSSGLGRATVLALAARGHTVFATMRDPGAKNRAAADGLRRLAEVRGLAIHVLDLDVTSDTSVQAAVATALAKAGWLDVAVNNAGYAVTGLAETSTSQQLLDALDANVVGMHRVNRAVLPGMRTRGSGLLIHISSIIGRTVLPFLAPYAAAKWAVEALAETYRYELKGTGIDATIVQPGPFPTRLLENRQLGADVDRAAGYVALANGLEKMVMGIEQLFALPTRPVPEEVADAIVALVESPAGDRPARLVVDRFTGDDTRALNDAHAEVQEAITARLGMSADAATSTAPPGRRVRAVTDGETVLAAVDIGVPPDRVFRALVTDEVEIWWGSAETYRMRAWSADLRVGGRWRVDVCTAGGNTFPASGEFLEIDGTRKVVQTRRYEWEHPRLGTRDTTVTYRFEPIANGTRLTVCHQGFAGRSEAADEHAQGWERALAWLEAYLRPAGAVP